MTNEQIAKIRERQAELRTEVAALLAEFNAAPDGDHTTQDEAWKRKESLRASIIAHRQEQDGLIAKLVHDGHHPHGEVK